MTTLPTLEGLGIDKSAISQSAATGGPAPAATSAEPSAAIAKRDAMIERTEEDWDKLQDAIGTLWGLEPGHVLTEADVDGLRHMDTCHRNDEEAATDAYNRGWEDGLRKRGGDELVELQKRVDEAGIAKATERAMRKLAERRRDGMLDVLGPFARAAEAVNPDLSDDTLVELRLPEWLDAKVYTLALGSLREARAAVKKADGQ